MKQFPVPGEEQAYLESLKEKARPHPETDKEKKRREREQTLFRKAHKGIYEEKTPEVGSAIRINGEEVEKKKASGEWIHKFRYWLFRHWWKAVLLIAVLILVVPIPKRVHRSLPAVIFSGYESRTDTLEIDGYIWRSILWDTTFRGRFRTSTYDEKVKGILSEPVGTSYQVFLIDGGLEKKPEEFQDLWGYNSAYTYFPAVIGDFDAILTDGFAIYMAAPAQSLEEAKKLFSDVLGYTP